MSGILSTLLSPFSLLEDYVRPLERRVLLATRPGLRGRLLGVVQILMLARRRCVEDHVGDRAAALAFSTLLSLVPLLLLILSTLSWVGYPRSTLAEVERWMFSTFMPSVAVDLLTLLQDTARALDAASHSLGTAGVLLLFLAASNQLSTLSRAFQRIWGPAGFLPSVGRIAAFWATVIAAPVLIGTSLFVTAEIAFIPGAAGFIEPVIGLAGFAVAAFAAYLVLPGKRVHPVPALFGAVVAGLFFDLLKAGFASYLRRTMVVSTLLAGLGLMPVFLLWLYFTWVTFLFGAECAWCAQEFEAALARHGIVRDPLPPRR